jgi:hypothetical protein
MKPIFNQKSPSTSSGRTGIDSGVLKQKKSAEALFFMGQITASRDASRDVGDASPSHARRGLAKDSPQQGRRNKGREL